MDGTCLQPLCSKKMFFSRLSDSFKLFFVAVCVFLHPVCAFAADEDGEGGPEWVLSYFLVCLCLGLGVAILLRPCNRSDTAFSQEEVDARHEEEMKKLMKH